MNSLVSVIVPVYNVEKYIHRCMESILTQTYENIEVILVNDGSPDNSPMICEQYAENDNRVKVIHKENGGLSDARNAGLKVCNGEYILFVDSDDYLEHNLIQKAVEKIELNKSDIVIWGYYADYVDSREKLISTKVFEGIYGNYNKHNFKNIPLSNKLIGLLGYAWNKLYRAEIIHKYNHSFIKGLSLVEDIVFNGPVLEKCSSLTFIEEPLVHYMQRPRETLGTKFYENYFELKKMAMESVRSLFISWNQPIDEIEKTMSQMGFNTIRSTISTLSKANNYSYGEKRAYLMSLLKDETIQRWFVNVRPVSFKDKLIKKLLISRNIRLLLIAYNRKI